VARLPDAELRALADEGNYSVFADRLEEIFTAAVTPVAPDD